MFPIELTLAVPGALGRLSERTARSRGAQDLSGIQVRRDGGDSGVPGFDHQVAAVHGARSSETNLGSSQYGRGGMSCSSIDLKAYFLGELPAANEAPVEDHVRACAACREELERLDLTRVGAGCRWPTKRPRSGSRSFPTKFLSRAGGRPSGARDRRWALRRRRCWRRRFWCMRYARPASAASRHRCKWSSASSSKWMPGLEPR